MLALLALGHSWESCPFFFFFLFFKYTVSCLLMSIKGRIGVVDTFSLKRSPSRKYCLFQIHFHCIIQKKKFFFCYNFFPHRETGPRCPVDNTRVSNSQLFKDNFAKREVLSLNVKCAAEDYGCTWHGELRNLEVCSYMYNH